MTDQRSNNREMRQGNGGAALRYGSVCSGIESASVAWGPLGWQCQFMSEIDKGARAVLSHRYPEVPLHGDFTTIQAGDYAPIDLLVGGTPCQDFSIAGLRAGISGKRGNLTLEYVALLSRLKPRWFVFENVPGILSSDEGRAFGAFLGLVGKLGYGFAYRVLDAQFVRVDGLGRAVPQRRERVFVVGYLGDWRRAAAVFLERHCLQGHPAPSRKAGQGVAGTVSARTQGGGGLGTDFECAGGLQACHEVAPTLDAHLGDKQGLDDQHINGGGACSFSPVAMCLNAGAQGRQDAESETLIPVNRCDFDVAHALRAQAQSAHDHTLETYIAFSAKDYGADAQVNLSPTMRAGGHAESHANAGVMPAVAYAIQERAICENPDAGPDGAGIREDLSYTLEARSTPQAVAFNITPSQSNKDFNARPAQYSQALTGSGNRVSARGGDVIAEPYTLAIRGRPDGHRLEYRQDGTSNAILTPNGGRAGMGVGAIATRWAVRRLTPNECESLQGFPRDYTLVPVGKRLSADGPRYKQLGNSKAVNVVRWIGQRIQAVEDFYAALEAEEAA